MKKANKQKGKDSQKRDNLKETRNSANEKSKRVHTDPIDSVQYFLYVII